MKSTPKTNPLAPTPLTVTIVKGLTGEHHVAKYIYAMFEYVGARLPIEVHVEKKIKGSNFHKGVECKGLKFNAVRMTVETDGNGSNYLCYVRSPEMRSKDILELLDSKLTLGKFDLSMVPKKNKSQPGDLGLVDVGEKLEAAVAAAPKVKTSLAGVANDPDFVLMLINGLRYRHGTVGFSAKEFHEVVRAELDSDATSFTSGQCLRRVVQSGYFSSEGKAGEKTYRLTEKGLELLTASDDSVAESAASALKITSSKDLHKGLAAIEARARRHADATKTLAAINAEMKDADEWVASMQAELDAGKAKREELRADALVQRQLTEDPELVSARLLYEEFQARLMKKT